MCVELVVSIADPVWVIVRVPDDASVMGLANQLSTITTQEADMESDSTEVVRDQQQVATNPFGSSTASSYQDHPFGSGSMMTSPHSIPTGGGGLEQLLLQSHTPPPINNTATSSVVENVADSITAVADSTTQFQSASLTNQGHAPSWDSSAATASGHNQTSLDWASQQEAAPPILAPNTASTATIASETASMATIMDDSSSETNR